MTPYTVNKESFTHLDSFLLNEEVSKLMEKIIPEFEGMVKTYVFFNCFFFTALAIEASFILFSLSFLIQSFALALGLSLFFLTFFSYLLFRFYLLEKREEEFSLLKDKFKAKCQEIVHYKEDEPLTLAALSSLLSQLSSKMYGKETSMYRLKEESYSSLKKSSWGKFKGFIFKKIKDLTTPFLIQTGTFFHQKDVLEMRECLLKESILEYVKLVRMNPTNFEVHAALANAYVLLSNIYMDFIKGQQGKIEFLKSNIDNIQKKWKRSSEKAIQEFKILKDFAPNEPWVHLQLAYSYKDFGMFEEELQEFEELVKLSPYDLEVLYTLGSLYFERGKDALGLKVYEQLKGLSYKKAESLIKSYGSDNLTSVT